jgi:type IV secretion system protein VirB4
VKGRCLTCSAQDPSAGRADDVAGFKVTDTEFDTIRNLTSDSRMFLVKQGDRSTVCSLNLYGFVDELEMLTATPESVELCEDVRKYMGTDDADKWAPVFLEPLKLRKAASKQAAVASNTP